MSSLLPPFLFFVVVAFIEAARLAVTYRPSKPSAACKKSSKRSNSCSAVDRDAKGIASTSRSYSMPKKLLVKYGRLDEDPSSFQLGNVGFLVVAADVDVAVVFTTRCCSRCRARPFSSSISSSSSFSSSP